MLVAFEVDGFLIQISLCPAGAMAAMAKKSVVQLRADCM
jgi:hypothetical protein